MKKESSIKSVYIHIPFCKKLCSYCDFCKNYYDPKIVKKYLRKLKEEVSLKYKGEALNTIYIGGGTPSSLSEDELCLLFEITNSFSLNKTYEFTFECNYEDLNENMLKKLIKNKVNRLSIGMQTFNSKFSKVLNRKVDKQEMSEKINLAKKYFSNINIDLMYALPNESIFELEKDLEDLIKIKVTHISIYALIIEENTVLSIKKVREVDDEVQEKMYFTILKLLKQNGYNHYEISNFSKPGFESKHNLNYWNNEEYYGFGAGASGFVNNVRYDNTRSIKKYIDGNYLKYSETLDLKKKISDEIMLNLRKTEGINKANFFLKYNKKLNDLFDIEMLKKQGFLLEDEKKIWIAEKYLFVSNEIILRFLENSILNN